MYVKKIGSEWKVVTLLQNVKQSNRLRYLKIYLRRKGKESKIMVIIVVQIAEFRTITALKYQ